MNDGLIDTDLRILKSQAGHRHRWFRESPLIHERACAGSGSAARCHITSGLLPDIVAPVSESA
jgi:hypothetical protein